LPVGDFVDRLVDILDLLADRPTGMSISDISRQLGMPKSAVHRLLGSLVKRGYAAQDEASQRYRLTVRLAAVGFRFLANSGITDLPAITDRLAAQTGNWCVWHCRGQT
jgi:DNA-binding IclR family transcriptional regulator